MNSAIINDTMTLDEKLEAIEKAMQAAVEANKEARKVNPNIAPLDPSDLTQCLGCQ